MDTFTFKYAISKPGELEIITEHLIAMSRTWEKYPKKNKTKSIDFHNFLKKSDKQSVAFVQEIYREIVLCYFSSLDNQSDKTQVWTASVDHILNFFNLGHQTRYGIRSLLLMYGAYLKYTKNPCRRKNRDASILKDAQSIIKKLEKDGGGNPFKAYPSWIKANPIIHPLVKETVDKQLAEIKADKDDVVRSMVERIKEHGAGDLQIGLRKWVRDNISTVSKKVLSAIHREIQNTRIPQKNYRGFKGDSFFSH